MAVSTAPKKPTAQFRDAARQASKADKLLALAYEAIQVAGDRLAGDGAEKLAAKYRAHAVAAHALRTKLAGTTAKVFPASAPVEPKGE